MLRRTENDQKNIVSTLFLTDKDYSPNDSLEVHTEQAKA